MNRQPKVKVRLGWLGETRASFVGEEVNVELPDKERTIALVTRVQHLDGCADEPDLDAIVWALPYP